MVGNKIKFLQLTLESLVKKQLILRLEKGKYCRRSFRNEYVIGTFLAHEGIISYWTALNLHGLTDQFSNTILVQTDRPRLDKVVFGVNYKFIKVKKSKFSCYTISGYGNNAFKLATVEKTILDCLDLPVYNGGTTELYYAISKAKLSSKELIEAAEAVGNIAAIKRLGFLLELFEVKRIKNFIEYAQSKVNKKYNLLDPQDEDQGAFDARWKLRINVERNVLIKISQKMY
jgi:predicted transcriptional regulator of viral defense system